ncbi:hypothetical protein SERLADRAFT_412683 [Serpula lacrymans var. lacrymans S7.9]|uniref:INO80 complex subunit B-like conserved region domain-containing protein n=1 Tax=Serpula lacrymans var. lacrymans (strain S7.9) TaxID=578457 RepID=F8NI65_SERL9|nr:uncharacterized protein SERLADRAFT_412683 [Serpula lacrymans var. lacrymans S7.9]EGO28962.1 hypothetical protein SERLADRAFT_412683 [Serpula lacrymans var. lacrymans S7.9]
MLIFRCLSVAETSRKKKQLNETELALRREETARKRRNLSEKKLEDEKVETINRLLKKQSKSKNKRNALSTADDRTPLSATPALVSSTADGLQDGENSEPVQVVPTMYRWISTAKPSNLGKGKSPLNKEESMRITFSIPASLPKSYVMHSASQQYWWGTGPPPDQQRICDVDGCKSVRKYGLVRDSSKSACGMDHLKVLERQINSA